MYIGGHTEVEMKERKDRATDALHATRAAVEEGVVPGGGTALIRAVAALNDRKDMRVRGRGEGYGVDIVSEALEEPLRQIAENAGYDPGEVVAEVADRKGRVGFDVLTGEYTDLVKAGVIDPAKVVVTALRNAVSIAGLNLTTNVLVTDVPDDGEPALGAVI